MTDYNRLESLTKYYYTALYIPTDHEMINFVTSYSHREFLALLNDWNRLGAGT